MNRKEARWRENLVAERQDAGGRFYHRANTLKGEFSAKGSGGSRLEVACAEVLVEEGQRWLETALKTYDGLKGFWPPRNHRLQEMLLAELRAYFQTTKLPRGIRSDQDLVESSTFEFSAAVKLDRLELAARHHFEGVTVPDGNRPLPFWRRPPWMITAWALSIIAASIVSRVTANIPIPACVATPVPTATLSSTSKTVSPTPNPSAKP